MGPSQVVDSLRRSVPASIGWAQRPPGGRTRELAWTRRPTPPPGQGPSHQTRQNRPNRPGRTRRRTSVRRRPARPRRWPGGSRPSAQARPLRRRVPATVLRRRLLRRPATPTPTPGPVRPLRAGSNPSPSRPRPRPSNTPARRVREAGSRRRPRRPGQMATPVGPEAVPTQRLRDPRRRPLRGKRSRAGGWRRRLGTRRGPPGAKGSRPRVGSSRFRAKRGGQGARPGLPGPRPGRSETRPSRLRATRGRPGPGRDRPGAGRSGPHRSPRRSLASRTPKPRRSRRPLTIPLSASLPRPSIATWDRSRRPLHRRAGSAPIGRAAKGASDAQRGRQRSQLRCPLQLRRPRRRFLVQPLLQARTALQAQRPIRLHRRRHVRRTPRTSLPRAAPPPSARSSRRIPLRDPSPHRPSGRTSPRRASPRPPPPPPAGWSA
jgi:hypothetical protein